MDKREKLVLQWAKGFGAHIADEPSVPSAAVIKTRIMLIEEELKEVKEALIEGDILKIAKEYADLQYVVSGGIIEAGLASDFDAIYEEVHQSNMTKFCVSVVHAQEEAQRFTANTGIRHKVYSKFGRFFIKNQFGKIIKPSTYRPADMKKIFS